MAAPTRAQLVAYARQVAVKNGLDPNIFVRQIDQESGFNPNAHNASGADGIGQLMPQYYPNVDTRDPYASLDAAAATMGGNLKRNGGDYAKALAAYNAGQGNVDKYGGVPPFAETQSYIKTILGAQGGKTMGQMQDGTTDPALDDILNQAANGSSPSGVVPDGTVGTATNHTPLPGEADAATSGMDGITILRMLEAKLGGGEAQARINPSTIKKPYDTINNPFGPTENPNPQIITRYSWPNGKYVDIVGETGKPAYIKGGTALAVLSSGTAPTTQTFPDHSLRQYDPDTKQWTTIGEAPAATDKAPKTISTKAGTYSYDPASGAWSLIPGTGPANVQIHTMPDGSLQQYDPDSGQWTMIQPRYVDPIEEAHKKALTAEANANTAKTQMSMRPTAQAAIEDANASIDAISKQYIAGTITAKEMNDLMAEVHQGVAATLAGTTLFEQQQQAQNTATQRAAQATSLLNQRVQSAASLGASLFSSATGHVLLPKGQATLGIDPMAIANEEVNAMGGGQATGDAASAFLKSVFGGQGGGDAPPPPPGQAAPGGFPTTREAVLAQYPHLASPVAASGAAPFVAPNFENGAGGPGAALTVAPPRPMSLTNQIIQQGG